MVRRGLILPLLLTFMPVAAMAQTQTAGFSGLATVFIGAAHAGDVSDPAWTPGASMAVLDVNGFGAELDLAHAREFNSDRFLESGITSLTVNATWVWSEPDALVRPYAVGGVGLLRVRACVAECQLAVSRTDWAMDIGGGAFVQFTEALGARADIRYFRFFQRHDDLPLTDNGFFDFWRTSGGLVFSWPIR